MRPPYGSFSGKVGAIAMVQPSFVMRFTLGLGIGGVPWPGQL